MCNWCRVLSNRGTTPLDCASLIAPPHCDSSSRNCVRDTDRPTVAGPSYWVTEKLTVHESKAESLVHVDLAWPWDTDTCSYHKSFIRCKCTSTYDFCCGPIIRGKLAIMREHFAWFPGAFAPFASFMQYDILRSSRKSAYLCQAHEMSRNNLSEFELAVLFTQFIVLITLLTDMLSLNMLPCELCFWVALAICAEVGSLYVDWMLACPNPKIY